MLAPRGILKAPWQVGAAGLRRAGTSSIKVTYAQAVSVVELIVHLSQIFVEVIRGSNISLPSCVAIGQRKVGKWDVVVDDLHGHRILTVGADHVRDAVADERPVSGRIGGLGRRSREVAGAFQRSGHPSAAQECTRGLTESRIGKEEKRFVFLDRAAESSTKLVPMKRRLS